MAGEVFASSLTPDHINSAVPRAAAPMDDGRMVDAVARPAILLSGDGRTTLSSSGAWGMGKSAAISLIFHALVVTLLFVCVTGTTKQHEETVTVFLTEGSAQGEGKDSSHNVAPFAAKRAVSPAVTRHDVRFEPRAPEAAKSSPLNAGNDRSTAMATTVEGPTVVPLPAEQRETLASGGIGEGQGRQTGAQPGPAHASASDEGQGVHEVSADGADRGKRDYLAQDFRYIRDMIVKNMKYPYDARRMGWKGSVTVAFTILENGTIDGLRVTKGSGHDILDQSVLMAVRSLQPFPRPPKKAELVIPVAFRLN